MDFHLRKTFAVDNLEIPRTSPTMATSEHAELGRI